MRLSSRLQRLEQCLGGRNVGCPACRDRRGRIIMLTSRRQPDGTTAPVDAWPPRCEQCGEVPEQIIEIIRPLVESRESAARLADEG